MTVDEAERDSDVMSRCWELRSELARGRFVLEIDLAKFALARERTLDDLVSVLAMRLHEARRLVSRLMEESKHVAGTPLKREGPR